MKSLSSGTIMLLTCGRLTRSLPRGTWLGDLLGWRSTYIVPFLLSAGVAGSTGQVLLLFGCAALGGIAVVGALIDWHLRRLVLGSQVGVTRFPWVLLALVGLVLVLTWQARGHGFPAGKRNHA
ncbi:hypothetical protein G3435_14450 [Pseudomonas sp. MAFF212428]|uniref:Uncharacterized protein n=1 Tax=Pseudomonas brassicae TaxID=2708063 RepID=A0A6B3NYK0_9PSED|nr:hypothetical protein [Pseudomonas brassicae]NER60855.1 hypothetical protein [Pseudomonas brassicae]NER64564.1 hypothetical protein [Pseudomonas brassicae]